MIYEKVYKYVAIGLLVLLLFAFTGLTIQTIRLESSMERCQQYREQLEFASNREREIGETISRTSILLSETSNTASGLREKLKILEDSYNYMWKLLYNDTDSCSNKRGE
jgi:hypothetical protein